METLLAKIAGKFSRRLRAGGCDGADGLVFGHEERQLLRPLGEISFNTDDVESAGVTKSFRVRFDRCTYAVPPQLVGQSVVVRANDDAVAIFLGPKQVAMHRRSWDIGQDIEHPAHREAALAKKPRATASALPPGLVGLGTSA